MMNPEVIEAKNWYRWLWISPLLTIPTLVFIIYRDPGYDLVCGGQWERCDYQLTFFVTRLIAIAISALWHLVLLIPIFYKKKNFVRWHGFQAFLLAEIRTSIPLAFLFLSSMTDSDLTFAMAIPVLILVWVIGTYLSQRQASKGDCTLMRWSGFGAVMPLPVKIELPSAVANQNLEIIENPMTLSYYYYQHLNRNEKGKIDESVQILYSQITSGNMPKLSAIVTYELNRASKTSKNLTADFLVAIFRFSDDPKQRHIALTELKHLGFVEPL